MKKNILKNIKINMLNKNIKKNFFKILEDTHNPRI